MDRCHQVPQAEQLWSSRGWYLKLQGFPGVTEGPQVGQEPPETTNNIPDAQSLHLRSQVCLQELGQVARL